MDDDLLRREIRAAWNTIWRDEIALLCLGPKGQHFNDEDWERRANELHADPAAYLNQRI
jgi:hypothetical protein